MKLANLAGRLVLVVDGLAVDVERESNGAFAADPQAVYGQWDDFISWAATVRPDNGESFAPDQLDAPVPRPAQVFAIGVNYVEHAEEAGYPSDSMPVTFTKFPSCLTGPDVTVELPSDVVDWEVELVIAISHRAEKVSRSDAWNHIAGLTIGQDLSERVVQMEGTRAQFSLGKSFAGFGPTGPWLVSPDEFEHPDDLEIGCGLGEGGGAEQLQLSRTSRMIYDIPELIVRLSNVCALLPGDIIFTGTPSGIGNARTPKRFLTPDDVLVSTIEGIGSITTRFSRAATE